MLAVQGENIQSGCCHQAFGKEDFRDRKASNDPIAPHLSRKKGEIPLKNSVFAISEK